MKIGSSTIGMESARSYKASNTTVRRFVIRDYQASLAQGDHTLNTTVKDSEEETEQQKGQAAGKKGSVYEDWQNRFGVAANRININSPRNRVHENIRQITIRYIFEMLFAARRGRLDEWMRESNLTGTGADEGQNDIPQDGLSAGDAEGKTQNGNGTAGMQGTLVTNFKVLSYTQETIHIEKEDTSFSTVGTVRTEDGREINFNVNVGMSREFQEYYREELGLASFKMCDPLVINLDTDVAELSDQQFYFDIDADGEMDEISQLGSGSGYLALDKNGDGIINDGSELFGTSNGDGFADLARYDEDGNGWIDENDAVWSKLKIWCKDENGKDVLYRLADKGVGAICLQKVATDFTLQGDGGRVNGAIRSTGVFLYENGSVGTMQHVDLAKYSKEA